MNIRRATYNDLGAITEIYNYAIEHTVATFDTDLKTIADRKHWLDQHSDKYPVLVLEEEHKIKGWASLSRWSERAAYDDTAELSIYFYPEEQGKGYGNILMQALIEEGQKGGLHTVLSRITEGNDISIHLHRKLGFQMIGPMKQVGKKFGKLLDVFMMQLIYE